MDVVIPTYGRYSPALQTTRNALMSDGITPTLVVQHREINRYDWCDGPVHVLPPEIQTIAPTRDWLIHSDVWCANQYIVMLDDDLHFFARRADDPTKFRALIPGELKRMLGQIEAQLAIRPHVGIAAREGAHRVTSDVVFNTRIMRVLGYDRNVLEEHHMTFAPMEVMEDFHMSLQILKAGYATVVLNNWCSNQAGGSGSSGGCSSFRTLELQRLNAERLASLHPGYVSVVEKTTKTAWGGATRSDVIVQWKAARRHSSC